MNQARTLDLDKDGPNQLSPSQKVQFNEIEQKDLSLGISGLDHTLEQDKTTNANPVSGENTNTNSVAIIGNKAQSIVTSSAHDYQTRIPSALGTDDGYSLADGMMFGGDKKHASALISANNSQGIISER